MSLKLKWFFTLALFFSTVAEAATYTLPGGTLPNGCSRNARVVICTSLNLSYNDVITISGSGLVTLNISGTANFSNAKVNVGGGASKLTINRSEEHTSELQSRPHLVCRLLLEKKKNIKNTT